MKYRKMPQRYAKGMTLVLFSRYVFHTGSRHYPISQSIAIAGTPKRPAECRFIENIIGRRKYLLRQWKRSYRINSTREVAVGMGIDE